MPAHRESPRTPGACPGVVSSVGIGQMEERGHVHTGSLLETGRSKGGACHKPRGNHSRASHFIAEVWPTPAREPAPCGINSCRSCSKLSSVRGGAWALGASKALRINQWVQSRAWVPRKGPVQADSMALGKSPKISRLPHRWGQL